jgi:transposase InsO family protein
MIERGVTFDSDTSNEIYQIERELPSSTPPDDWGYSKVEWEVYQAEVNDLNTVNLPDPDDPPPAPRCLLQVQLSNGGIPNDPDFRGRPLIALLDSGSSVSLTVRGVIPSNINTTVRPRRPTKFITKGGTFVTHSISNFNIMLPQFSVHRKISLNLHVDETIGEARQASQYDFILGRDFLNQVGIVLDFKERRIQWDELSVPMVESDDSFQSLDSLDSIESATVTSSAEVVPDTPDVIPSGEVYADSRDMTYDADAYKAHDLTSCVPKTLSAPRAAALLKVLSSYRDTMKGGLGMFPGPPLDLELVSGAKPFYKRPYPIPRSNIEAVKAEVDRMVNFGILEEVFETPYASPSFAVIKKNGAVRIVTDFRYLNTMIVRYPYPLPTLSEIFTRLDGFDYCSALDLSMGFYHVPLSPRTQLLCTTAFPWGKYKYKRLPMGLSLSPDVFQHRMNQLLGDLPYVINFIDDLLITTKGSFELHLQHIAAVFDRLRGANLQVNVKKSSFFADELPYLGFILSAKGIRADPKKVAGIEQLAAPQNRKQLRSFLGMVNYIRELIPKHSQNSAVLTDLLSTSKAFVWTEEHDEAFAAVKEQVMKTTMLSFPDYARPFEIYTDAAKRQLGAVIFQRNDDNSLRAPIAFFSKKMNPAQSKYTITEQELLSVVETLKTYRNMLYGYPLVIYTDHKNLTFERFSSDRVTRWRLYTEEFNPKFVYLPGKDNVVADALSRLPMKDDDVISEAVMEELFEEPVICPIDLAVLRTAQQAEFSNKQRKQMHKTTFGPHSLWTNKKHRICIPPSLQNQILSWYHEMLRHPGINHLEQTLTMHFAWPSLRTDVLQFAKTCDQCQRLKRHRKHYGHLPDVSPNVIPWHTVAVDLVGPWTIRAKNRTIKLSALTVIDVATRWMEIARIFSKEDEYIAKVFDREWLSRYPRPLVCIHDEGGEFGHEFRELLASYGIQSSPIGVKNPQSNAILERTHQTIGDMLRTYEFENMELPLDDGGDDTFDGILASVAFAMRAAYHTALKATPAQMVFGRDMFFPTRYLADWTSQGDRQKTRMITDNQRENRNRIRHDYKVGDKVLIRRDIGGEILAKMGRYTYGPFTVTQVFVNGTVEILRNGFHERINIRRLLPYFPRSD